MDDLKPKEMLVLAVLVANGDYLRPIDFKTYGLYGMFGLRLQFALAHLVGMGCVAEGIDTFLTPEPIYKITPYGALLHSNRVLAPC